MTCIRSTTGHIYYFLPRGVITTWKDIGEDIYILAADVAKRSRFLVTLSRGSYQKVQNCRAGHSRVAATAFWPGAKTRKGRLITTRNGGDSKVKCGSDPCHSSFPSNAGLATTLHQLHCGTKKGAKSQLCKKGHQIPALQKWAPNPSSAKIGAKAHLEKKLYFT